MKGNFKKFLSLVLAISMLMGMMTTAAYAVEDAVKAVGAHIDKTATPLKGDFTDVTLSVPGEFDSLGVDIIYIAGAYLEKNQVESDLMIESLYSTFEDVIAAGVPVSFGFVPFSYDDKPVMELTKYDTVEKLESDFRDDLRAAIDAASGAYGGENMENALQIAKNMFAASELSDHPERQHLVLVSSGHTYNFNVGENNEIFSTVPVAIDNSKDYNKLFFGFKAWMQARNYNPNNYPIPKAFTTYNDYRDWDAYWAEIEKWAAADVANGDKGLYKISDTTDYSYTYYDWYMANLKSDASHNNNKGLYKSYGMYIYTASDAFKESAYGVKVGSLNTTYDKVLDSAKHAISYERAMWEASNFIDDEITGAGINFYPIYNQMKPAYTNGVVDKTVSWTQQYIGHSFMNMLARKAGHGLEAVNNSTATDKAFFDPIKEKILYTCSVGSYVEDYIGYNRPDQGNFEFIQDPSTITMIRGGKTYTTTKIETKEGATASYKFSYEGEKDFFLDYYYGNGQDTEKFIWTFGDYVSLEVPASLTYKLELTEKSEIPGTYTVDTNLSATLYPKDSQGKDGEPQKFPVPSVTYEVKGIDVPVVKIWDDADDADGIRPDSITIRLMEGETEIATAIVTEEDGWKYTFTGLREYRDGVKINYTITEDAVEGYTTSIDGYTVTNTHEFEKVNVSGTKTWNDNDDQDGIRPDSITIKLYADGELVDSVEVTAASEWKYSFENLPKNKAGVEIEYTIGEVSVEGYETKVDGFNVTNTHTPEQTTVSGTKTWNDANNQDGKRPTSITINLYADGEFVKSVEVTAASEWKYSFNNLPKYENGKLINYTITEDAVAGYTTTIDGFNVTNTYNPEQTTVSGGKIWNDANNQDGKRPTSITINLLANGVEVKEVKVTAENGWQFSFNNLPKYENGKLIVYTITEDAVEGYTTEINGFNVTNTYNPEQTTVSGGKIWNDANNQDGKRPESITINLLANGTEIAEVTVTAENGWQFSFNNLPKYENGALIVYTITEDAVEGYTTTIDGFNVTNTYAPETINVSVNKVWDDDDNSDDSRPGSIIVDLFANGVKIDSKEITAEDNWSWIFTDLAKYENGVEIVYTVSEVEVEDYISSVEGNMVDGFVITNTYLVEIPDNPPPLNPPKTGDNKMFTAAMAAIVAIILAAGVVSGKKRTV